jgi:Membrane carboxypeptidase/penicillin-binding protein
MYFNQLDFLYQAVGINSAAAIYFDKTPAELSLEEAAVFVGMAKNPALYNPKRYPERMQTRRSVVLRQMVKNDMLSEEAYDSLKVIPIELRFNRQDHLEGSAPYFREYLRQFMQEWLATISKPDGEAYNLYTDGLKIYTTIDSRLQSHAEEAVSAHMANLQRVFFRLEKGRRYAPFHKVTQEEIDRILTNAMRRTPRYRGLKAQGKSEAEIRAVFQKPIEMSVFSWQGDIDTLMSPLDSIRYYKHFYQAGLMSVEPQTGFIKAWVGGNRLQTFQVRSRATRTPSGGFYF